jgi:hypothetical protein
MSTIPHTLEGTDVTSRQYLSALVIHGKNMDVLRILGIPFQSYIDLLRERKSVMTIGEFYSAGQHQRKKRGRAIERLFYRGLYGDYGLIQDSPLRRITRNNLPKSDEERMYAAIKNGFLGADATELANVRPESLAKMGDKIQVWEEEYKENLRRTVSSTVANVYALLDRLHSEYHTQYRIVPEDCSWCLYGVRL